MNFDTVGYCFSADIRWISDINISCRTALFVRKDIEGFHRSDTLTPWAGVRRSLAVPL